MEVFDHYFNLKSNLNKTKQSIPQDFDLEICEAVFKNHVLARCEDKSNLMNLSGNYKQYYSLGAIFILRKGVLRLF